MNILVRRPVPFMKHEPTGRGSKRVIYRIQNVKFVDSILFLRANKGSPETTNMAVATCAMSEKGNLL